MADRKVIIIGSGPAGLTAALYTARANLKPLLIEGLEAGGQLMLTTLVENWPGFRDGVMGAGLMAGGGGAVAGGGRGLGDGVVGPDLMAEMRVQAERFGAEIMRGHVKDVDLGSHPFTV